MSDVIQITVGRLFALEVLMYVLGFTVCILALWAYKRFGKKAKSQKGNGHVN